MTKKINNKLWLIIACCAVIVVICVAAGIFMSREGKDPIYVYSFKDGIVGMTDYMEPGSDNGGLVSTDKVQPVFLTDTQTVLKVNVKEGQKVKKGDILFTYDTILSDIALKQKDIAIRQSKLDLESAIDELDVIDSYVPISYHPVAPPPKPENEVSLPDFDLTDKSFLAYKGTGHSSLNPIFCWIHSGTMIDNDIMKALFEGTDRDVIYVRFQYTQDDKNDGAITNEYGLKIMRVLTEVPVDPTPPESSEDPESSEPENPDSSEPENPDPENPDPENPDPDSSEPEVTDPENPDGGSEGGETENPEVPTEETETHEADAEADVYAYAAPDQETKEEYSYCYSFFNPLSLTPEEPIDDGVDVNSGFTSEEIESMRAEQEAKIKELEVQIKIAESEYSIMKKEADSGEVKAEFDGVVTNVLEPDDAKAENKPVMKVSGGGGFYITGSVSELDLDSISVGQQVTVSSWDTGESCQGEIVEILDFPQTENPFGGNSPNISTYPFKVFVDGSANLQDGYYVSISFSPQANQSGLYIDNAFLRTDGATSYVYVRGEDERLEKRFVKTGKNLWGSYTEIVSGITADDLIAFPYGKDVSEGAPTKEGTFENLYEQ